MKLTLSLIMAVLIGLCFTPAWAQEELDDFSAGRGLQVLNLGAQAFKPAKGFDCLDFKKQREIFWSNDPFECKYFNENYPLTAMVRLPSGANLDSVKLYSYDEVKQDPNTVVCEVRREFWNGGVPDTEVLATVSSDPTNDGPGYDASLKIPVAGGPIQNNKYWYQVQCTLGEGKWYGKSLRLYGLKLFYKLQIKKGLDSPFTDIGHLSDAYQDAINALYASGITNGCSDTEFCPEESLKRKDMAAFLAAANGLYWPLGGGY